MVSFSQYVGLLSAGNDGGGKGGDVLVEEPKSSGSFFRRSPSAPVLASKYGDLTLLSLPTVDPRARVPVMSPTSFSLIVITTLGGLETTKDYVKFMRKVDSGNRQELSKMLNIADVINSSKEKIKNLQNGIEKACHDLLLENNFNWRSSLKVKGQGHLAITESLAELLSHQKDLSGYFNEKKAGEKLDTEKFGRSLEAVLLNCRAILKEISEEESSLKELRELACVKKEVNHFTYTWDNCDF